MRQLSISKRLINCVHLKELCTQTRSYEEMKEDDICSALMKSHLSSFPPSSEFWPAQTQEIKDTLQTICRECWTNNPDDRIDMISIVKKLNFIALVTIQMKDRSTMTPRTMHVESSHVKCVTRIIFSLWNRLVSEIHYTFRYFHFR